jgi:hypothetical protein
MRRIVIAATKKSIGEFLDFIESHPIAKKTKMFGYGCIEDLGGDVLDSAYLSDATVDTIAQGFSEAIESAKSPKIREARLAKILAPAVVEKEAFSVSSWVINNADFSKDEKNAKQYKKYLLDIAKEWAKKATPEIIKLTKEYLADSEPVAKPAKSKEKEYTKAELKEAIAWYSKKNQGQGPMATPPMIVEQWKKAMGKKSNPGTADS